MLGMVQIGYRQSPICNYLQLGSYLAVLKSDSHIAQASLILIFEIYWRWFAMVCKPTGETGLVSQSLDQRIGQQLGQRQLESLLFGL